MTSPPPRGNPPVVVEAMEVQVEKLSPVLLELQIQVPADQVTIEVDGAFVASARAKRRGTCSYSCTAKPFAPTSRAA